MSYPGYLTNSTNVPADVSTQRSVGTFSFQLNTGAPDGPGSSLQSPASILPDTNGDISLVANGSNATFFLENIVGGSSSIQMGVPNPGSGAILLQTSNDGVLGVANAIDNINQVAIDTVNAAVTIGSTDAASTAPNSSLTLMTPGGNNATIYLNGGAKDAIHFSDPTTTGIAVYDNTAIPGQLAIGNDTTNANIATFNQLTNTTNLGNPLDAGAIYLNNTTTVTNSASRPPAGGIVLQQTAPGNANISQQVASGVASLTLGSSVANPTSIFINDTGGVADTAVVDITKGTGTGIALRLQGYGAGSAATVSTNVGVGGGGVLNLTSATNNPVPAISINDTAIRLELPTTVYSAPNAGVGYGGITQQIINSGGNLDQLPWNITNPSAVGFYHILVRVGDNAAVNINGQIDTFGYWNGSIWVAGGCGSSQPIGTGNLLIWFGSTATSRAQLILQNTGTAVLSQVAVYMVPFLSGSIPIMT